MKKFFKDKIVTGSIIVATVILALVAILTAMRLYQSRTEPVAPTAPREPEAGDRRGETQACQELTFTLTQETPTPSPTGQPSSTPTPTDTMTSNPTPTNTPTPTGGIGGDSNSTPTNTPAPTNTQIAQATPTTSPDQAATTDQLPDAGFEIPTIIMSGMGVLIILLAFAFAL